MKFEKITDTKIKIFFSFDDMNKNHISKKILFSNNPFSQNFIQSILKIAEKTLDFKIEDKNILVEILNYGDGCVFIITKISTDFMKILEIVCFIYLTILKIFYLFVHI